MQHSTRAHPYGTMTMNDKNYMSKEAAVLFQHLSGGSDDNRAGAQAENRTRDPPSPLNLALCH